MRRAGTGGLLCFVDLVDTLVVGAEGRLAGTGGGLRFEDAVEAVLRAAARHVANVGRGLCSLLALRSQARWGSGRAQAKGEKGRGFILGAWIVWLVGLLEGAGGGVG